MQCANLRNNFNKEFTMSHSMAFGGDPMDAYSKAVKVRRTKLATFFTMPLRSGGDKPGRTLGVIWDSRQALVEGFENTYSYLVKFTEVGNIAGNHYHKAKHELMYIVQGQMTFVLKDMQTNETEEHRLTAADNIFVYVQPPIAHAVVSQSVDGILLVIGNSPGTKADEYPYEVVKKYSANLEETK